MASTTPAEVLPTPEILGEVRAYYRGQQLQTLAAIAVLAVLGYLAARATNTTVEGFLAFFPGFVAYVDRTVPPLGWSTLPADIADWFFNIQTWLKLLFDTVLIAFIASFFSTLIGGFLAFPGSRNLMRNYWIYFAVRRLLEVARAVPEIVYALIFVYAFGLGPLAGVLAITIHSTGALGKLFSEVNENVDLSTIDGVKATGANWFELMRHAVLPQVLPNYLSYILLRFEINVRSAAIIGLVGAGGIGQELYGAVRMFAMTEISAIIILIMITVSIVDITCERLRLGMIEGRR